MAITSAASKQFRKVGILSLQGPLANDATARILHNLLVALACWRILCFPLMLPLAQKKAGAAAAFGFMLLILILSLYVLRRGLFVPASLIYLCGTWLLYTLLIALSMGIRSRGIVFYMVLPISAAWLLGFRAAFLTAAACLFSSLTFALILQMGYPLSSYFASAVPVVFWGEIVVGMIITTVPVASILQSLQQALAQSKTTEMELKQYQAGLEELVCQRTKDLQGARDQAEAAVRAKSLLLANVSHELRSPLNTILLLSDPEWVNGADPEAHRHDLQLVQVSGTRLLQLIDDLLDSARIEAGQLTVENRPFDLSRLIREVTGLAQVRAEAKELDLCVEQAKGCPRYISSDADKLRHVLTNLLDNAIKYTDCGQVALRQNASVPDSFHHVRLEFEIADTGIGISREDQDLVFMPFARAANVGTRRGTGLGLSIARRYVEAMGGSIRLESIQGSGSRFFVDLPVELAESCDLPAEMETPRVTALTRGQSEEFRVLIVDDSMEDRLALQRVVEAAGFQAQFAETGRSAIEAFLAWQPHLIWIDRRLPVMDGLEAARCIRSLEGGREVKIVAISASLLDSEREEVLAAGLDDFIRKPLRPSEIYACMAEHLGFRYVSRAVASPADLNRGNGQG
jgi:signal transduction histidine kinase/ActR/RegA family two-component response regulator